jgi:hypothetical protein
MKRKVSLKFDIETDKPSEELTSIFKEVSAFLKAKGIDAEIWIQRFREEGK